MNLAQLFEHHGIAENPFRGEEAAHDPVFARLARLDEGGASADAAAHSDFEKVLGDPGRPSTSVVFGEKGSGKTAMRMLIGSVASRHNRTHAQRRVLLVPHDDLNAALDLFHERHGGGKPGETIASIRLSDHMDLMLGTATTRVVDSLLGESTSEAVGAGAAVLGDHAARTARRMERSARMDLLLLQVVYDRSPYAAERTGKLKRTLGLGPAKDVALTMLAASLGWVLPAAVVWAYIGMGRPELNVFWYVLVGVAVGLWAVALLKMFVWDRVRFASVAKKVTRSLRLFDGPSDGLAGRIMALPTARRPALPTGSGEDVRYAMLDRLRRVLARFGHTGLLVVVDRVDEPTLISGDAGRMKDLVWPMLSSKFLQQEGLGLKMLLPIELRYALFRESSAFFQEARLDKQNLVERLTWTGAMLYDLCDARLRACVREGAAAGELLDLFAEDVSRQDLVDALDQMHQPRDAFKFMYRCLNEHCSNVTAGEGAWRVPRLVVETVRKQESDRVQQLERGIRPA